MAKKKRYFKKKAVLRAISKYQRRKINYICSLIYNQTTMKIDNKSQLPLQDVLSSVSGEYLTLGRQYAMVKIRGIRVKIIPVVGGQGNAIFTLSLLQANDNDTFDSVRTQPHTIMLDTRNPKSMYVPISGTFNATNSTDDINNLKLVPQYTNTITAGEYMFGVQITLYLTFKSNL